MNELLSEWFNNLESSALEPIVRHILDRPTVEVLDRQIQSLSGGASAHIGFGLGVYRVAGTARDDSRVLRWTAIVKVIGPSDQVQFNDPASFYYWKRELLAYQSGLLDQLPGNVFAPRCYAIHELPGDTYCVWLEAIHETDGSWTMGEYHMTARHLGQFNGAYLNGYPLPQQAPWMTTGGRTKAWLGEFPPDEEELLQLSETFQSHFLSHQSITRMMRLWEARSSLLTTLERLPTCFCHNDASRRNLMFRQTDNGTVETVAIDWAGAGLGKVGQEIAVTTAMSLFLMEVPAQNAKELDQKIFAGYSAGLGDAGWEGDLQLVRFGYTVVAALIFGVAFSVLRARSYRFNPARIEAIVGHPIDDIVSQHAAISPFLLDLGDEALALMPSIQRINE